MRARPASRVTLRSSSLELLDRGHGDAHLGPAVLAAGGVNEPQLAGPDQVVDVGAADPHPFGGLGDAQQLRCVRQRGSGHAATGSSMSSKIMACASSMVMPRGFAATAATRRTVPRPAPGRVPLTTRLHAPLLSPAARAIATT